MPLLRKGEEKKKKLSLAAELLCSHTLNYFITFPVQTPTANTTCPSSSSANGSRHRCQASYLDKSLGSCVTPSDTGHPGDLDIPRMVPGLRGQKPFTPAVP